MTKKVLIKIAGVQSAQDETSEPVEVMCVGTYYKRNGKHFIKYDEPVEESDDVNNNLIKISDNEIEMTKKGQVSSHMVFTLGQKNMTFYNTPFGNMYMGIETDNMEVSIEEALIRANIEYAMELNYEHVARCSVNIEISAMN